MASSNSSSSWGSPTKVDEYFGFFPDGTPIVSTNIFVAGDPGLIVTKNSSGNYQVFNGVVGRNPISAVIVVSSAYVGSQNMITEDNNHMLSELSQYMIDDVGTSYDTSATNMSWESSPQN